MKDHGGNIYTKARKNGFLPGRIIDFSASSNPLGMPPSVVAAIKKHISLIPHYPEPYSESLSSVIASHCRVSSSSVLCGNGSTELIYLIGKVLKPQRMLTTAPAFSEYEKACDTGEVIRYPLIPEDDFAVDVDKFIRAMQGRSVDLVFLGNPNNPTGRLIKKHAMLKIADAARKRKCYLVVDEAFMDFCPGESLISAVAKNPYLIVLRSLTKFYALAGLRLGFGIFPVELAETLKQRKEPWSVNTLAVAAGSAALSGTTFRAASLALIAREKRFVEKCLTDLGIKFYPSDANYYLLQIKNAGTIIRTLEKKGILLRDCSNFNGLGCGFIRIAVRSRKENALLMKELEKLCRAS